MNWTRQSLLCHRVDPQQRLCGLPPEHRSDGRYQPDDPAWRPLPPAVTGTGGVMTIQDTNTPTASRYYRLRLE